MSVRPRRQVYVLSPYIEKLKNEVIRSDQDVQRLWGSWDNETINGLIYTILTDDYIPPIILAEEKGNKQLWIIDGLHRSFAIQAFRYGLYKTTMAFPEYIIEYQRDVLGEDGERLKDENGDFVKETIQFDLRKKKYEDLPLELKTVFDDYQLETVIHEDCTRQRMSELVRRYNNHTSMNPTQKAFTYISNFSKDIRRIVAETRFFKDCGNYGGKDRVKGVYERIVAETVMTIFHIDHWQKQVKKMDEYLNLHSSKDEFAVVGDLLSRLEKIITERTRCIFTSKNSFVWFSLFEKFSKLGIPDQRFGEFIEEFIHGLSKKKMDALNGNSFEKIDSQRNTRDKRVVVQKIEILEMLMAEFLSIDMNIENDSIEISDAAIANYVNEFSCSDIIKSMQLSPDENTIVSIRSLMMLDDVDDFSHSKTQEYVSSGKITNNNIDDALLYLAALDEWSLEVNNKSSIFNYRNIPTLLKFISYAYKEEVEDDALLFFIELVNGFQNSSFGGNEIKNYHIMISDLTKYIKIKEKKVV